MLSEPKFCIVIPCYNHALCLASIIDQLERYGLPIIIVDDGGKVTDAEILNRLTLNYNNRYLVTLSENQGKGGAVIAGFRFAETQGFTHVLQIDADGQHAMSDIPKFIQLSQEKPNALISGQPIYNDSVPKSRLYSRYITHFCVWVETLSLTIKDSMCGFRIYPLKETLTLIDQGNIGRYMDFDIEIMVRLYWSKVAILFINTKVDYPEFGVSNFNILKDNVRISWMHTRLFFGMLIRLPSLIWRKCVK